MDRQGRADKREKSVIENITIGVLVLIMMVSFIYYFFKQEKQLTKVAYTTIANTFSTRVTSIRGQWFMDNQPSELSIDDHKVLVKLNSKGWVDFSPISNNCEKIWQAVMSVDLTFMKQPVSAISLTNESAKGRFCRYQLASGEYFDYSLTSGVVKSD